MKNGHPEQFIGLVTRWADKPPTLKLEIWRPLVSYRPSESIQKQVIARGKEWAVHRIEDGVGPVNLDYYSLRVSKLPPGMTQQALLMEMRRLLDMREAGADANEWRRVAIGFEPFDRDNDGSGWAKLTPGTVLKLHFFMPGQTPLWRDVDLCKKLTWIMNEPFCQMVQNQFKHNVEADEGCIVISEAPKSGNNVRVSTIRAGAGRFAGIDPKNAGAHPVSGNREFGFTKAKDVTVFYVIGADRLTPLVKYDDDVAAWRRFGFAVAEVHWRLYLDDLRRLIVKHGGEMADEPAIMDRGVVGFEELKSKKIYDPVGLKEPKWLQIPQ